MSDTVRNQYISVLISTVKLLGVTSDTLQNQYICGLLSTVKLLVLFLTYATSMMYLYFNQSDSCLRWHALSLRVQGLVLLRPLSLKRPEEEE